MSHKTIADLISQITWDRRIIRISGDADSPIEYFMLKIPSVYDRNMANHIKDSVYEQAIQGGATPESELLELSVHAGLWSDEKDAEINGVLDRINQLESRMLKEKTAARKKKTKQEIADIKGRVLSLEREKANLCIASADYMAHEHMVFFLVSRLTCDMNGQVIWANQDEFEDWRNEYPETAMHLARAVTEDGMINIKDIRRVARSPEWRLLWTCSNNNIQSLFTQDIRSLNINQKMLIYWSRVYDSAFESPERPDDKTLEDDDMFDAWFQNRIEEREEKKLNKGHKINSGSRSAIEHHHERGMVIDGYYSEDCTCGVNDNRGRGLGETPRHADSCSYGVFVDYSNEEKEQIADQIYGRNTSKIRKLVNSEQEYVADHGEIEEQHLRNKKSRMTLGSEQKFHARKR